MSKNIDISIIVPVYNEQDSLKTLFDEIKNNINSNYNWELIFINDGSSDNSKKIIFELIQENKNIRLIDFYRNHGKSEALNSGFKLPELFLFSEAARR